MKFNFQNKIIIMLFLMTLQFSFSQKKEGNIGSEVVNVVKPYTPTVADAVKVPENPVMDDEGNEKKETIKYSIFSFPVASTFTPAKGRAEGVEKAEKEHYYNNYATLGIGNYGTINAELFVNQELGNDDYIGAMIRHLSSQGGIEGEQLDNYFYDTSLDVTYGANYSDMSWNLDLGYQNQIYNWYGLPEAFGSILDPTDRAMLISGIDSQHNYDAFTIGGRIGVNEGVFKEASVKFNHFTDNFESSENRFYAKPSLKLEVADESIRTDIIVDYVGGSFEKNYMDNVQPLKYGYTNLGLSPNFVMLKNGWTLNLGASLFYSMDNENSDSKFFVYPNINASYNVVGDLMIFYAGAEGNLEQNTYMDFVSDNPFLSPTLYISPTDKQYDVFAGLKGKLASNVSYNIRGSYMNERNKAFFKSNDYNEDLSNENYEYGNSFQVVYDDLKTVSFSGDLKADFSDNFTLSIGGTLNSYKNDVQQEAWNLPTIKLNSKLDFNITSKWFAGATVFYVGERKDIKQNTDIVFITAPSPVTLDAYIDLNAHVGFKYNNQLTGFLKVNNITAQNYQKWMDYPVQGVQLMLGANYKFDF